MNAIIAPAEGASRHGWAKGEVWAYDVASTGMGGDDAVGTAYESRYVRDNGDGTFGVATFLYFVEACRTTNQPEVRDSHVVTGMYQFTVCTDPDDPGSTELWSQIDYDTEVSCYFHDDLSRAEGICRLAALNDERWTITWNGRMR